MSSGFTGGGPDFYAGRSMNVVVNNGNGGGVSQPGYHHLHNQIPARMQPGIFIDSSSATQVSQITNRVGSNLIGKRSYTDFHAPPPQQQVQIQPQFQQQFQQNQALNNLYLRSVKPRVTQSLGPYEDLYRYRLPNPLLQLQQQQIQPQVEMNQNRVGFGSGNFNPYLNSNNKQAVDVAVVQEKEEKKMQMLKELEKQLLDDNDEEDGGDAVSVITNMNSEWSETIQNLMSPTINKPVSPISPSPTTSSSSSSSSVASPATICTKQTVIEAATAISDSRTDVAAEILNRLSQVQVSSKGNSEQRLMEYMTSALKSRLNTVENPAPVSEFFTQQHTESTQCLYDLSPCFKLGFMAANLAILEAVNECNEFHVVDFDIGQGGQYMNLLHALAVKQNGKNFVVTITAVGDNVNGEETLATVGEMLKQVAERVGVRLIFKTIRLSKLSDLSRESLGCEPNEPLAVNFAFKLFQMPDESVSTENPRDDLLRRVKALSPRVVTLIEQELNTNTAPFLHRVNETMSYYGALLDSIESASRDHQDRVKVEEGLGRKLSNSVACEGRDRVERCEVFGKWRARMSMAGFQLKPMSQTIAESMRARLSSGNRVNPGFTVKEENGGVSFGWMGRILTVASAWR